MACHCSPMKMETICIWLFAPPWEYSIHAQPEWASYIRRMVTTIEFLFDIQLWRWFLSWLQIQRPGFDSRRYQIFWEVVGLERGPLSLVTTTEELLGRKSSCSGLENREDGRRRSAALTTRHPLYLQKLALTSPTSSGRSVGTFRSRAQATEFSRWFLSLLLCWDWSWDSAVGVVTCHGLNHQGVGVLAKYV
jgi:hypothetical protein